MLSHRVLCIDRGFPRMQRAGPRACRSLPNPDLCRPRRQVRWTTRPVHGPEIGPVRTAITVVEIDACDGLHPFYQQRLQNRVLLRNTAVIVAKMLSA